MHDVLLLTKVLSIIIQSFFKLGVPYNKSSLGVFIQIIVILTNILTIIL